MSTYLECAHCHCSFLATDRQAERARSKSYSGKSYCSKVCFGAAIGNIRRKPLPFSAKCQNCGSVFGSRHDGRMFCSLSCYTSSDHFLKMVRANVDKANAASVLKITGKSRRPRVDIKCLQCGTTKSVQPAKSHYKFCNQRCYRSYMADRFDRWVASPRSMALPHNYDEFMMQEELPCLVDGCTWVGHALSNHVNFAHGIPASEFKRAAGFNLKTGLVSSAMAESLSGRPHIHENNLRAELAKAIATRDAPLIPVYTDYKSLEGKEHMAKSIALRKASTVMDERICVGCGTAYRPAPLAWSQKYCSFACRDSHYAERKREKR